MTIISWTCFKCEKVQGPTEACAGCGATYTPKPPYPFCNHPEKCIPTGRCERKIHGEPWVCCD